MPDDQRSWQPIILGDEFLRPSGAYSPAAQSGDLIFVSGQVPRNPRTGDVEGADIAAQTERVLENLRLVLERGRANLEDVVSVTVYLADENDWGVFNDIYKRTFRPPYPARTVVGARLREVLVEVSAIARVASAPRSRGR